MTPADRAYLGRQLWLELHTYAWEYPREPLAEDQREFRVWLADWTMRIPRFGCRCHQEWDDIMELCPPPLDNGDALYWWTVAAHDRINRTLNKPLAHPTWSLNHPLLAIP